MSSHIYPRRLGVIYKKLREQGKSSPRYINFRHLDAIRSYEECRRNTDRYHNIRLVHPYEDDDGVWDFGGAGYERGLRGATRHIFTVRPEGTIITKGVEVPVPFKPGTVIRAGWRKGRATMAAKVAPPKTIGEQSAYTTTEMVALLGTSRQAVHQRAQREGWTSDRSGCGPGGGHTWLVASMSVKTRTLIRRRLAKQSSSPVYSTRGGE